MDHLITNADLAAMLAAKDPRDRIVCCSQNGTQYVIDELGRDAQQGRILIRFHGDTGDLEKIGSLENQVDNLNGQLEDRKEEEERAKEKTDEKIGSLENRIEELMNEVSNFKKQVSELEIENAEIRSNR